MSAFLRILLLSLLLPVAALCQFPGATSVGSDAPAQAVTLTLPGGGTLDTVHVLTGGVEAADPSKQDFKAAATGTCTPSTTFPAGATCTLTIAFHPTAPGVRTGAVVLLDHDRNSLATQFLSAQATGSVLTFLPGTINTVAGDEAWIYAGDQLPATQASIFLPFGIAVDAAGNLFIADSANNRIRRVDAASGLIATFAGTGTIGYTGDAGPATQATLSNPTGLALDPAGNLFLSDSGNNVIRRIDAFTGLITTVATHLTSPNGLAFSAANQLYIAATGDHLIRRLDLATGALTTLAGRGTAGFSGDGGPALSAALSSPWSVTLSASGDLLIADQNNHRIRLVTQGTGLISTVAGTGQPGFSGDTGPASQAQLNVPASVAFDVAGNLYIADSGNNRIRKVAANTGLITTVAGNSGESISGDSGRADQAGLYGPYTLAIDSTGSLLIADVFHNRVRRIAAGGATLDFPAQRVGRISAVIPQIVENDGNASLNISAFTPVSHSQLDPSTTTCTSAPLLPFAQCIAGIQFAPTTTGDPVQGRFDLVSDAIDSPSGIVVRGKVLDVDPASITLTSGQNPSTTGQPVAFNVTVTSGGATPTGTVTLVEGASVLASAELVPGGTATLSVAHLTGGNHALTANYAGDSSNSTAVSAPFLQVVKDQEAATATTLTSSANPIDAGATLHLIAVVTATNPAAATGQITGSVAYKEGLNTLGVATVINGQADLSLATLTPGTHSISATYTGSNTYTVSTSTSLVQGVKLATSQLVLATSANPSTAGLPITLTLVASSSGGTPHGTTMFFDGLSPLGSAVLNAQGIATLTVPGANWLQSPHALTASYAGDMLDGPAHSNSINELINVAHPVLTLASSLTPAPFGGTVTLTATGTSNGSVPSGSVQFVDGLNVVGKTLLNAAGSATLDISSLALGSHTLTAIYSGDSYNTSAYAPAITQQVEPTAVSVTLGTSMTPALLGAGIRFSMHVSGTGAQPGGKVMLSEGSTLLGSQMLDQTGAASLSLSTLPLGTHLLTAQYQGDTSHAAAVSAPLTQQILQATTTLLVPPPAHAVAGGQTLLSASTTGSAGQPITGALLFRDGTVTLATVPMDSNGRAAFNASGLAVGNHSFTAAYAGDTLNAASVSIPASESLESATTSISLVTSANPVFAGDALVLSSHISTNGANPTGTVVYLDGPITLLTVAVGVGGNAAGSVSTLSPGSHQLRAVYSGDAYSAPSTSPVMAQQVAQRTTMTLKSNANPALLSDTVQIAIQVGNGVAANPPTGAVTLTDGQATLATLTLSGGMANFIWTAPTLGQHTLVASYAGDAQNSATTSTSLLETVTLRPTTTSFTTSASTLSAGQTLILISVVQGAGSRQPGGTVSFHAGSTLLGMATLDTSGVATLSLQPTQSAVLPTIAEYSGDSLFAASRSPVVNLTINPTVEFTMVSNPSMLKIQSGGHATLNIELTAAATFKDMLAFGCAGLPAFATCTWSEGQVQVGGGVPHTLSVVVDTGNPLGSGSSAAGYTGRTLPGIFIGTLLALLLTRKRPKFRQALLGVLLLSTLAMATGCGTSFTQQKTAAGSYTFELIGTGKATGATQKTGIVLMVTQ